MPTSLSIGAFVLGSVLLLLSLVRGGFKLFGAEVTGSAGGAARVVAFVAGVVLIVTGFLHDGSGGRGPDPAPPVSGGQTLSVTPAGERRSLQQPASLSSSLPARDARLTVRPAGNESDTLRAVGLRWSAGTQELIPIIQSLTPAEQYALGMNAMATGQDIYAIHVHITNVGAVPVDVAPERVHLTYLGQPVLLSRTDDPRFLQARRLEPDESTDGLVAFTAPAMLGAAVMIGGRLTYQDNGVRVTYTR